MAITKWLARDQDCLVAANGSGGGFIAIGGVTAIAHTPSTTKADTTDFDDDGKPTHFVVERSDEFALSGHNLMDVTDGTRDPGQAEVELLAEKMGIDSLGLFQIMDPAGFPIQFYASVEVVLPSGGNNDIAAWSAKLTVSGHISRPTP